MPFHDHLDRAQQLDGRWSLGVFVQSGRIVAEGPAADHAALLGVAHADTIVVMMGASSIATTADHLMAAGRAGTTPVSLVSRGTTPQQRVVNADLATVGRVAEAAAEEAPMVMVVGDVARRAV